MVNALENLLFDLIGSKVVMLTGYTTFQNMDERNVIKKPPDNCVAEIIGRVWLTIITGDDSYKGVKPSSNGISSNAPELSTLLRYVFQGEHMMSLVISMWSETSLKEAPN